MTKSIKALGGSLLPKFAFVCCSMGRPALLHEDLIHRRAEL